MHSSAVTEALCTKSSGCLTSAGLLLPVKTDVSLACSHLPVGRGYCAFIIVSVI